MKASDLTLARIVAQRLAGPRFPTAAEAVGHLGCVQGQDLPGAITSVALRTASGSLDEVRDALNTAGVVRTWPMRGTLHLVPARDAAWMCGITAPRVFAQTAKRRDQLELTEKMIVDAGDLATTAIGERGPLTRAEMLELWSAKGFTDVPQRGYHLLSVLCSRARLVQGPLRTVGSRSEQCFVVLDDWVTDARTPSDREQALAWWATMYFTSHGPATVADFARWTGLTMGDVKSGLAGATGLASQQIDGTAYWHAEDLPDLLADHRRAARAVMLLPGFDELILGYADRTCTVSKANERWVVPGNNGMFKPTVLRSGTVVGTWKRVHRAGDDRIETAPFDGSAFPAASTVERVFTALPR